ncbi:MAG: hypothetical protein QMD46_09415 [Methanomicrobiales archaeon]|nr:hypothetical protein [Methanomicrobiales archaeon]MDI6877717.1 hypothetical protein [Methanomicrobiales archaeon]
MKYFTEILILGLIFILIAGCISLLPGKVIVRDAYCDLDNNFTFILENTGEDAIPLNYTWTLVDHMANKPIRSGAGSIVLQPHEIRSLTSATGMPFHSYGLYAAAMNVYIYRDGREIYHFQDYKSPYEWNYSVSPPVKYVSNPGYVSIGLETFIQRDDKGDFIVQFENFSYHPASSPVRLLILDSYLILGDSMEGNEKEWRVLHILNASESEPVFVDKDGDGCISDFDYFVVPGAWKGNNIRLNTANQFVTGNWYGRRETLEAEDRDAIRILNITVSPDPPRRLEGLEFIVEAQVKKGIELGGVIYEPYPGNGLGTIGGPYQQIARSGDIYTLSKTFDQISREYHTNYVNSPDPKVFYVWIRDKSVNERWIRYEVNATIAGI